jgi:uncharacterized protein YidB (DUF937 family)
MSRGFPSMTALLGLLAIAGYQNRDKIAELLRGAQRNLGAPAQGPQSGSAGGAIPGNLGGMLGGTSIGDLLSGGLRDLVDAFKQKGQGEVTDSWVSRGPNKQIAPHQLEQAIGQTCSKPCLNRPAYPVKSFFQRSPKICPTLSTSIRPKVEFQPQRSFQDPKAANSQ